MKRFTSLCLMLSLMVFTSSYIYAMGAATVYKITIREIQLLNDKGVWVTIATMNQEIDIASVGAAATAGSMVASTNIPTGKYVNFKVVLSNVMRFAGTDVANTWGVTGATLAGGTVTLTGSAAGADSTTTWASVPPAPPVTQVTITEGVATRQAAGGVPGEVTATLNLGAFAGFTGNIISSYGINNFTPPIEIKDSSIVSAFFQFDVQSTVGCAPPGLGRDVFYASGKWNQLWNNSGRHNICNRRC